jgi:hypothetical protein
MDPSNNEGNANTRKKGRENAEKKRGERLREAEYWSLIAYLYRLVGAKETADRLGIPMDPLLAAELKKGMAWANRQTKRHFNPEIPPLVEEYEALLQKKSPSAADERRIAELHRKIRPYIEDTDGVIAAFAEELGANGNSSSNSNNERAGAGTKRKRGKGVSKPTNKNTPAYVPVFGNLPKVIPGLPGTRKNNNGAGAAGAAHTSRGRAVKPPKKNNA